ncbi:MAG TPA: hypothetical protein VGI27_00050 [Solirubrobacteraceae bacterium]|jgi:hypothetical protein
MPRIIVTTETAHNVPAWPADAVVLLDEQVHSVHLSTGHAATQLVERLAWAIIDAEEQENQPSGCASASGQRTPRRAAARGARIRRPVAA